MTVPRRVLIAGLIAAVAVVGAAALPGEALARSKAKVVWSELQMPDDPRKPKREKILARVLRHEAAKANWGELAPGAEAKVKITEFSVEHRPDVIRVTCTAVGQLEGGPRVKTHFSFGGNPQKQDELETTMLTLIGRGVVTRLSAIARARSGHRL